MDLPKIMERENNVGVFKFFGNAYTDVSLVLAKESMT